jgi:hypothetical protein
MRWPVSAGRFIAFFCDAASLHLWLRLCVVALDRVFTEAILHRLP